MVGSRQSHYGNLPKNIAWGDVRHPPRTVFVRPDLLQAFFHRVLPCISARFVLLIGDHDITTPRQIDFRFPRYLSRKVWEALLDDERIAHLFVEHLDEYVPKVSALPGGISAGEFSSLGADVILDHVANVDGDIDFLNRPLRVLQVDRLREGPQWEDRAHVNRLCSTEWNNFCVNTSSTPGREFWELLGTFPFILCVHGGGLDPSPKAWEALLMGTIPIIQHYAGYRAYEDLPVVFIDSWTSNVLSPSILESWRQQLSPFFVDPEKRAEVLRRLNSEYWWSKVEAALDGRLDELSRNHTKYMIRWRAEPEYGDSTIH